MNNDVINLNDRGLEPGADATPYLVEYWESGAHVTVDPGTYRLSNGIRAFPAHSNESAHFTGTSILESTGGVGEEVVFERPDGRSSGSAPDVGFMVADGDHEMIVRHLTFKGAVYTGSVYPRAGKGGTVRLENVNLPDGNTPDGHSMGIYLQHYHAGEAYLVDCHVEGFHNNGVYGSTPSLDGHGDGGTVHIYGGLYRNNNRASVRFGATGSEFVGGTVVQDVDLALEGAPTHQRAIWLRDHDQELLVEDVDAYHTVNQSNLQAVIRASGTSGGRVEDCRIYTEVDAPAIATGSSVSGWTNTGVHVTGPGNRTNEMGSNECDDGTCDEATPERRWYKFDPDDSSRSDSTTGEYWGINPNSFGETMRIGSVEVHREHPFEER